MVAHCTHANDTNDLRFSALVDICRGILHTGGTHYDYDCRICTCFMLLGCNRRSGESGFHKEEEMRFGKRKQGR